jgi:hypothetical protein
MSSFILSYTCSSVICGTFYVCPKRTYSCIKRTRRQQVNQRERIPNAMFVTLSTYFYVGTRMLNYSRKDVVYTNADERRFVNLNIQHFSEVYPVNGLTVSPQSAQRAQRIAIPVTRYEKAAPSRLRTQMTRITRIFTDTCISISSVLSLSYRNPSEFITLYLVKLNSRSNYS